MKRSRTTIIGIACGLACAACVFAYAQGVRGRPTRRAREALARYGGEQLEACVAKRDIAAGESVDASARWRRGCGWPTCCPRSIPIVRRRGGKKALVDDPAGEVLSDVLPRCGQPPGRAGPDGAQRAGEGRASGGRRRGGRLAGGRLRHRRRRPMCWRAACWCWRPARAQESTTRRS
ncbi:MAG: hypothetical protein ACLSVD_00945 [Eggerthellaceae bacterium]